ncbi:MAG: protein kinase [Deltaproteobacteria bacterium]|nr:protein kinase [Deltaproteobacteria bacterium]
MASGSGTSKLERGVVIAGRYGLVSRLGSGGMGAVWRARHLQLDVDVAMKFMSPRLASSEELRERFEREAKAAARLRTRHVARVLDHGVDQDSPFIVLELLEGEDLRRRMARRGALPLAGDR